MLSSKSKIYIVGTSGAGKSTLARDLTKQWSLRDIELDSLFWGPNWTPIPHPEFREKVEKALIENDGWVAHGNYSKVQDIILSRAEIVIWLDYSLPLILWRVTKRAVIRILTKEKLWAGNRETVRQTFFSKNSIILWALTTYKSRRRQYEELMRDPRYQHIKFIRVRDCDRDRDGNFSVDQMAF